MYLVLLAGLAMIPGTDANASAPFALLKILIQIMKQYKEYLERINRSVLTAPAARENMPPTKLVPTIEIDFNFVEGFPILTAKEMPFYSILGELICFMQGRTDVRDFSNLGCNVWWDNAYKWNIKDKGLADKISPKEYREQGMACYEHFETDDVDTHSYYDTDLCNNIAVSYSLGTIYSYFWRHSEFKDQLKSMINGIQNNPYSRYHVIDAWDKRYMVPNYTSQPNCHVYYQATCFDNKYIDPYDLRSELFEFLSPETAVAMMANYDNNEKRCLISGHLTQRSCDAFLGVPFNVTSYSLATIIMALITNNIPTSFKWVGVNNHIYADHQNAVDQYLGLNTFDLPKLHIDTDNIKTLEDIEKISSLEELKKLFKLIDYTHGPKIKANLSVGL